jgi:hypothetical protein
MISNSVLFLNPNIDFIFLKVANLPLSIERWLVIIPIVSRVEYNSLVIQGILTLEGVVHTSLFLVVLRRFM